MPLEPAFVLVPPGRLVVERERPAVDADRDRLAELLNCGFEDHTTFGSVAFPLSVSMAPADDDDGAAAAAGGPLDMLHAPRQVKH